MVSQMVGDRKELEVLTAEEAAKREDKIADIRTQIAVQVSKGEPCSDLIARYFEMAEYKIGYGHESCPENKKDDNLQK